MERLVFFVERWAEKMALPESDLKATAGLACEPQLYMDPLLRSSRRQYRSFVAALESRGMITWTCRPRHHVTAFCVHKKEA